MGYPIGDLYGFLQTPVLYRVSETINEGSYIMLEDTATEGGEVEIADAATAALNGLGCALDTATYSTTQGDAEGRVRALMNPFTLWAFHISGGATARTAWPTTAPAIILTNTSASAGGTTVTAAEVGTANMTHGLLIGRTGANRDIRRKISAHTNSTSTGVTVPFPSAIAVNDTFIRLPYSLAALAMQLTTTAGGGQPVFSEANGTIATGTGVPAMIYDVRVDVLNDSGIVVMIPRTHLMNSLA